MYQTGSCSARKKPEREALKTRIAVWAFADHLVYEEKARRGTTTTCLGPGDDVDVLCPVHDGDLHRQPVLEPGVDAGEQGAPSHHQHAAEHLALHLVAV